MNLLAAGLITSLTLSSCANNQYTIEQYDKDTSGFLVYSCSCSKSSSIGELELHNSNQSLRIKISLPAYTSSKNAIEAQKMKIDDRWQCVYNKNVEKLNCMKKLEDNWEDGAKSFSEILINNVIALIENLAYFQPNVFPKYDSRIQLEFYDNSERYLQLVLSENTCELYYTDGINFDNDKFEEFEYDEEYIKMCVNRFYGNNLYERTIRTGIH